MRLRILQLFLLFSISLLLVAALERGDHDLFRLKDEVEANEGKGITFYDVLDLSSNASADDISKALKKKSRQLHPDKAKHAFITSRSVPRAKQPNEKKNKKKGTHISKGPSEKEIQRFLKQATERYSRLGVIAEILKDPETRGRYDHFLKFGFPVWRGTGYYYTRYRPGLGTVLVGLFLSGGGAAHYLALVITYKNQVKLLESYRKNARKNAWGDEAGIGGIPGLGAPTEVASTPEEPDPMANLNRKQRREYERQTKKDKNGAGKPSKPAPPPVPAATGERRRVRAENGKVFVVTSVGDVYLEEEGEDGNTVEFLLDPAEIPKPTIWDTAVIRLPIWAYQKISDRFLNGAKSSTEFEGDGLTDAKTPPEPSPVITITNKPVIDMSSSQISDSGFEIVDSTGIEKEIESAGDSQGMKKRGKKNKK